jgi:hypothetical protein
MTIFLFLLHRFPTVAVNFLAAQFGFAIGPCNLVGRVFSHNRKIYHSTIFPVDGTSVLDQTRDITACAIQPNTCK